MSPILEGMPAELALIVSKYLCKDDLLSLRLLSREGAKIPVQQLSIELKDDLKYLVVLNTMEGLFTLRGLCQIGEFLQHMGTIVILNTNLSQLLKEGPEGEEFRLEYTKETVQQLSAFESFEGALQIWTDVFDLLHPATKVNRVVFGRPCVGPFSWESKPKLNKICGIRGISFAVSLLWVRYMMDLTSHSQATGLHSSDRVYLDSLNPYVHSLATLNEQLRTPLQAWSNSACDRKLIKIQAKDTHGNEIFQNELSNFLHDGIQGITLDCTWRRPMSAEQVNTTDGCGFLSSAASFEILVLYGNRDQVPHCGLCNSIFRSLKDSSFSTLSRLSLWCIKADPILFQIVKKHQSTFRSVSFSRVELIEGASWPPIFAVLKESPYLKNFVVQSVVEIGSDASSYQIVPSDFDGFALCKIVKLHGEINIRNCLEYFLNDRCYGLCDRDYYRQYDPSEYKYSVKLRVI